ncbi:hypothetical protein CEXT_804001 [Caerostris extrusa]|uniref:Uncharacterized protein n=1 Tax=Caerostris extrusa TaxID=172846 RepID=A0AAV4Y3N9_CAEEX|nr:hypothetical protein CEXT_804001 [Caerostris extrusa]
MDGRRSEIPEAAPRKNDLLLDPKCLQFAWEPPITAIIQFGREMRVSEINGMRGHIFPFHSPVGNFIIVIRHLARGVNSALTPVWAHAPTTRSFKGSTASPQATERIKRILLPPPAPYPVLVFLYGIWKDSPPPPNVFKKTTSSLSPPSGCVRNRKLEIPSTVGKSREIAVSRRGRARGLVFEYGKMRRFLFIPPFLSEIAGIYVYYVNAHNLVRNV